DAAGDEQAGEGGQALLALAGAGAEAGVALDLLDVGEAGGDRALDLGERDVLAAADEGAGGHGMSPGTGAWRAAGRARAVRWAEARMASGVVAPASSPIAHRGHGAGGGGVGAASTSSSGGIGAPAAIRPSGSHTGAKPAPVKVR